MTLIKWNNPSQKGLQRRNFFAPSVENIFSEFFNNGLFSREFAGHVPSVNISENEQDYQVEVSAPGFTKNDFNVKVEEGVLIVSGEHKTENNEEGENFIRREFSQGSFSRSFNFEDLVDEDHIDAKYDNGILRLKLPKSQKAKAKKARQIVIA